MRKGRRERMRKGDIMVHDVAVPSSLNFLKSGINVLLMEVCTVKIKACNAHQIWCATFVPSGTPYMA